LNFGGFFVHYNMIKKVVNLIFEALHLKQIKHEWVRLAGVKFPDSVAEHSLNAAQIWYMLAHMEWVDPNKVASMMIRHDIAETRIWDIHKVQARYLDKKGAEDSAINDQMKDVPWWDDIISLFAEYKAWETDLAKVARDANYLEMAFQAKIYVQTWYTEAQDWIKNVWWALQTESAKQIREEMQQSSFTDWRQWLKKLS